MGPGLCVEVNPAYSTSTRPPMGGNEEVAAVAMQETSQSTVANESIVRTLFQTSPAGTRPDVFLEALKPSDDRWTL